MTTRCEDDLAPAHSPGKLRARRKKAGLSQKALAEQAGVTQPCLSMLECGQRSPGLGLLLRLAEALGCTPADLIPGQGGGA